MSEVRLTSLAHGGGCGCKLSPAVLADILARTPRAAAFANLMVGTETSDDAAAWRLNDEQALVATTDFFMPIVDDPRDFGAIAATNALSDVYAVGARPILALAIVGMPVDKLPAEIIGAILAGGAEVCAAAGIPIAGGHSIDSVEPIYGLVALGLIHPDRLLRNSTAQAGDDLILTKPLGVGVLSAAFKQGRLSAEGYGALIASTTQLNTLGADLAGVDGVHALTDVTGFGLIGHTLEMCRAAGVGAELNADPPMLAGVETLALKGVKTGAAGRNWESGRAVVDLPAELPPWRRDILTDPQTSGGLLIAAAPGDSAAILELARRRGFGTSAVVGRLVEGDARVRVVVKAH
jgi:selenide,water dikinase